LFLHRDETDGDASATILAINMWQARLSSHPLNSCIEKDTDDSGRGDEHQNLVKCHTPNFFDEKLLRAFRIVFQFSSSSVPDGDHLHHHPAKKLIRSFDERV
jgi:hypothetical protein